MAAKKVSVGIVGTGLIGRDHALSLARSAKVSTLRIFDADAARAAKVAGEVNAQTASSLKELIDQSDIVWICSPPFAHLPIVKAICKAGKPMFCEKPLAHSLADAKAIRAAVKKARVPLFMGHSGRYTGAFILMHKLVQQGVVGDPTLIWSHGTGYLDPKKSVAWRLQDKMSGGAIVELGVHEIDFINWIGGDWKSVAAIGSSHLVGPKFQDTVNAIGTLKNGAHARIDLGWANPRYLWQRGIDGTDGGMIFDDSAFREIVLHRPGKKVRKWFTKDTDYMDRKTGENLSLRAQDADILNALIKGDKPPVDIDDGFAAVNVAFAIRESSKTGKTVQVKS